MKTPSFSTALIAAALAGGAMTAFADKLVVSAPTPSAPPVAPTAPVQTPEQIAAIAAVEANPDSPAAFDQYEKAMAGRSAALMEAKIAQYQIWAEKYPDSPEVAFRVGAAYSSAERPEAKPYLLKAVKLNPKNAPAYQMLAFDSERWGSEAGFREYMHDAMVAAPTSPDYAFYYTFSYRETTPEDHVKWEGLVQDFAKQFSTSERGAQALYWLGVDTHDDAKKIAIYEQEKVQFPPAKFNWSADGMDGLYGAYMRTDPAKALALANEMKAASNEREAKSWAMKITFTEGYLKAQALLAAGNAKEALATIEAIPTDRRSENAPLLAKFKAEAKASSGDVQGAYDSLVDRVAATPDDSSVALLATYGKQLGKTGAQLDADVWLKRNAAAKPSPKFNLGMYTADKKLSLDDLHGKVVLLTFWFPGCGPCRGEFPHFETVMARFHGQPVTYIGINVSPEQDSYVLPFMAGTNYTFIPLHGDKAVTSKEMFNVHGEPTNFLIDQEGRIVYTNFRAADAESELLLQRMIESLLAKKLS